MNNMSSELIVKLQEELVRERERTRQLEEVLQGFVTLHRNKFGLDGAWDEELVKAERLLEESGR